MAEKSSIPIAGGNLVAGTIGFFRDPLPFLERAARAGDVTRVMFGAKPSYFVTAPRLIEGLLIENQKSWVKDRFARVELGDVLGQGMLTSDGEAWRRSRRLAQPAFHKERIAGYADGMVAVAERFSRAIEPDATFDMHHWLMHLTLEIVSESIFGVEVGAEAAAVGAALDAISDRWTDTLRAVLPFVDRLPLPQNARYRAAKQTLDQTVYAMIRRGRRRADEGALGQDLLSMLLAARDDDGSSFDDRQLRDEIMTIYLAGHETTALALSWTFVLLSQHPTIDAALGRELDEVLGDRTPTLADLPRLDLAGRIVLESMRIYPPAWATGREAAVDLSLGGVPLRAGDQVWTAPWVMHRDPRFWDDPDEFVPDRWPKNAGGIRGSEAELQKLLPRCVYFPFGAGPRQCIGREFALMEAVLVLATVARRHSFRLTRDAKIEPLPSVTLRPKHGVKVIATRRDPRQSAESVVT
jgi:cytochrome P450